MKPRATVETGEDDPWVHSSGSRTRSQVCGRAYGASLGAASGEGAGLTFADAGGIVKLMAEMVELGLQVLDALVEGTDAGTQARFHICVIGTAQLHALASPKRCSAQFELERLHKYQWLETLRE
jgi:hypothetical protein